MERPATAERVGLSSRRGAYGLFWLALASYLRHGMSLD